MIRTKTIIVPDAAGIERTFAIRPYTVGEIRNFEEKEHVSKIEYVRANLDDSGKVNLDHLDFTGLKQLEDAILAATYQTETTRLN